MKKILNTLVLVMLVLAVYSCQDLTQMERESKPINLGAQASSTKIISAVTTGSTVKVIYNLTVGAKYSVQIYAFGDTEPRKTLPMTAAEEITTQVYNLQDLPNGLYDLTLTDISGNTVKQPIIIKR